jgi:hypothetical protein
MEDLRNLTDQEVSVMTEVIDGWFDTPKTQNKYKKMLIYGEGAEVTATVQFVIQDNFTICRINSEADPKNDFLGVTKRHPKLDDYDINTARMKALRRAVIHFLDSKAPKSATAIRRKRARLARIKEDRAKASKKKRAKARKKSGV